MLQAKIEMDQLPHGHSGGHAHVQIWSKAKTLQKGCTDFIFEPKWPLLNSKQLWFLKVLIIKSFLN